MTDNTQIEIGEEKVFRFNNMRVLFTYSQAGHFDKTTFTKWFTDKTKSKLIKFIRLAHETGDDGDNPHTHVLVEWQSAFQTKDVRFFDYENHHPNIKILKNKKAFDDCKKYIAKEDSENNDLKVQETLVSRVFKHQTVLDAIADVAGGPTDVCGIMQLFSLKNSVPSRFKWEPETDFHRRITALNDIVPDDRSVVWCYDPIGNTSKTNLAKWLYINYPNKWYVSKDLGTSRDAATIIAAALSSGWEGWGFIIDLPRSAENHNRIYSYIEEIKDGFVTTQKYQGKTFVFDRPHVVIFANWLPKIECLSRDRWKIIDVKSNVQLTLNEVALLRNSSHDDDDTAPNSDLEILDIMRKY